MKGYVAVTIVGIGITVLTSACATKRFVREQVGTTETRLAQRVETQETGLRETTAKLGETSDLAVANKQAIETTGQQLQGLDTRVGEASALAGDAKKEATAAAEGVRDTDSRLSQRLAARNVYSTLDTKTIYFGFAKADVPDEGMAELEDVAKALKADPNAVVELQGFADSRGDERYNYQLTRERVDAVTRYLVQRHGIDLRRIHAVGMGKVAPTPGEKATRETLAKSRRVDIRLLAPQS
jgi:outer membrane protein OmpA-like peptidoglycan-associated protein